MSNPLAKVTPGAPFSARADTWNHFVDAAKANQRRQANRVVPQPGQDNSASFVRVRNDTLLQLDQFAVLGLDDMIITPTQNLSQFSSKPVMSGVVPDETHHRGRFAVMQNPTKPGEISQAVISGITPVRLNIDGILSIEGPFADVLSGQAGYLQFARYGSASILWRETFFTGEGWALINIGQPAPMFHVNLTSDGGDAGSAVTQPSWTYGIYDSITAKLLASAVNPTVLPHRHKRPAVGRMSVANTGLAYWHNVGALSQIALLNVDEQFEQEACV